MKKVHHFDVMDVVKFAYAGLQQDAPESPTVYLNNILNLMFAYLTPDERKEIETYLAEKSYLPDIKIEIAK